MAVTLLSGGMLQADLIRGEDLSIESNLIYFDVTNNRIGVNQAIPATDFDVNGDIKSTTATVGDIALFNTTLNATVGNLTLTSTAGNISVSNKRILLCADPVGVLDVVNLQTLTAAVGSGEVTPVSQQIIPDGITAIFTLNKVATTDSILVIVNGLVQDPAVGAAYTVSGTTLTLAEIPIVSDTISVRFLSN